MDLVHAMRVFVCVAETGNFTRAANSMGATVGGVSRTITELEAHLEVRLLVRSTRKQALTSAGQRYLATCLLVLGEIDSAAQDLAFAQGSATGTLHIKSSAGLAQHYVLPAVALYRQLNPKVSFDLTLAQTMPDIYDGKTDVAIVGANTLPDSECHAICLGSTYSVLCASPEYIRRFRLPVEPSDLARHECLLLSIPTFRDHEWQLERGDEKVTIPVAGSVKVNIPDSLVVAIRENMGIGVVPAHVAKDGLLDGSLVRVLPEFVLQRKDIYAIYASRKYLNVKTRDWIHFLQEHFHRSLARDHELLENLGRSLEPVQLAHHGKVFVTEQMGASRHVAA